MTSFVNLDETNEMVAVSMVEADGSALDAAIENLGAQLAAGSPLRTTAAAFWMMPEVSCDAFSLEAADAVIAMYKDASIPRMSARLRGKLDPEQHALPVPVERSTATIANALVPFQSIFHSIYSVRRGLPPGWTVMPAPTPDRDTLLELVSIGGMMSMLVGIRARLLSAYVPDVCDKPLGLFVGVLAELIGMVKSHNCDRFNRETRAAVFSICFLAHKIVMLAPHTEAAGMAYFAYKIVDFFCYSYMSWQLLDLLVISMLRSIDHASPDEVAEEPSFCPFLTVAQLPPLCLGQQQVIWRIYQTCVVEHNAFESFNA